MVGTGMVLLPVVPLNTAACAVCPSTGLLAVAGSSADATSVPVLVLQPSSLDVNEFCQLGVPRNDEDDTLQGLSWSPHHSRRALLTATRQGRLLVWSQVPHDMPGLPHVPTVNQWYGHELQGVLQGSQGGAAPPQVVHAAWLSPPASKLWSVKALTNPAFTPGSLDNLFLPPGDARQTSQQRHWVRPAQLSAAVVDSRAGLKYFWATMGRHPNQLQWHSSQRLSLLQPQLACDINTACCCAIPGGGVLTALISTTHRVFVCLASKDPATQLVPNLPHHLQLQSSMLVCLDISTCGGSSIPHLQPVAVALANTPVGTTLYVLAKTSTGNQLDDEDVDHTSFFLAGEEDTPPAKPAADVRPTTRLLCFRLQPSAGPGAQPQQPQLMYTTSGDPCPRSLSVSHDHSKVAFVAEGTLFVLETEQLKLLHQLPVPSAAATPTQNGSTTGQMDIKPSLNSGSTTGGVGNSNGNFTAFNPNAQYVSTCFSPMACVVWLATPGRASHDRYGAQALSGQQGVVKMEGQAGAGAAGVQTPPSFLQLQAIPVPDMHMGSYHNTLLSQTPSQPLPNIKPQEPLPHPEWEAHAQLTAARLVWALLEGLPVWCLVHREQLLAKGCMGWGHAYRALYLLDYMLQTEEVFPRPAYCAAGDRLKVALLRVMPGHGPASLLCDLVARGLLHSAQQLLYACYQSVSGPDASALTLQDVATIKPWMSWYGDFVQLMLASLKTWSTATANLPEYTGLRAPHVSQAPHKTEEEVWHAAAQVAEQEGPGAAWAYLQEAQEAGGPLSPEQAAAALPMLRLLMDRRVVNDMRYLNHIWGSLRAKLQAAGHEEDMSEEGAQARHQLAVHVKQLGAPIEQILSLGIQKMEVQQGGQQKTIAHQQQQQPSPQALMQTVSNLFPSRLHLHLGRCTLVSSKEHLQSLLSSPGVLTAPLLTPRQILARARELGLMLAPALPEPVLPGGAMLPAWHAFRRQAPPADTHASLLLLDSPPVCEHDTTHIKPLPGASASAAHAATGTAPGATPPQGMAATPGGAAAEGATASGAEARAAKKRRWQQQRAVALAGAESAGLPLGLAYQGSTATAAIQENLPILDPVSAERLQPGTSNWISNSESYLEAADGFGGVTLQLEETALQQASQPNTLQFLRRAWIGVCPITGAPWKRVRVRTAPEPATDASTIALPVW